MNDSTINLVKRIKEIRKEKGLTQAELAKRCQIPQSTIGRIESFSMNPSINLICTILDVLNTKICLIENANL